MIASNCWLDILVTNVYGTCLHNTINVGDATYNRLLHVKLVRHAWDEYSEMSMKDLFTARHVTRDVD